LDHGARQCLRIRSRLGLSGAELLAIDVAKDIALSPDPSGLALSIGVQKHRPTVNLAPFALRRLD
jgi:hypothetical protein